MERLEIKFAKEVYDFIHDLPKVLITEGYKTDSEAAHRMTDEILSLIFEIGNYPHYRLSSQMAYHFERYGHDLWYTFFRRKSSRNTTWYVFFEKSKTKIIVKHISNNWIEGQYLR